MSVPGLVSIGIPVHNEARHLPELLESIISDSYPHKEIIISDNASDDGSWEVIEAFCHDHSSKFPILTVCHEENRGALFNFQYVLSRSRGEFFIWAGGHDVWGPGMVEASVDVLRQEPDAALAMPLVRWIDSCSNILDMYHCVIDTTPAKTPAARVYLLFDQWRECTVIYGLHRRRTLLGTLPWPNTLGSDNIGLVRIACEGSITFVESTYYLRRARYDDEDTVKRQVQALNLKGSARSFPRTTYRLSCFIEVAKVTGPFSDRLRLITRAYKELLGLAFFKTVLLEVSPRGYSIIRNARNRLLGTYRR